MDAYLVRRFEGEDLVPDGWDLPVSSVEDILFLGGATIREMIRSWRSKARDLSYYIKKVSDQLEFLKGKAAKDVAEAALRYENVKFTYDQIGERFGSWSHNPEPLDEISEKRERDATTFNLCGWCEYAVGGLRRYNYMSTTYCDFLTNSHLPDDDVPVDTETLKKYANVLILSWNTTNEGEKTAAEEALSRMEAAYPGISEMVRKVDVPPKTERRFNTPCFLTRADDSKFEAVRAGLSKTLADSVAEKRLLDSRIKFLLGLVRQAEKKPALPKRRPYDWFSIGDPVICFVGSWTECIVHTAWAEARVIDDYRHNDGCISVQFTEKVHNGAYLEGHGGTYGLTRPEVMHAWEFDYLRQHTDFARIWACSGSKQPEGYNSNVMLAALKKKTLSEHAETMPN